MMSIASLHARKMNKRLNRVGHVFQDRYQAIPVKDDEYLLELCYYIHQNPVKAKMVKSVDDYPWSSHHCYLNNQSFSWLSVSFFQSILAKKYINSQNLYASFIQQQAECEIKTSLLQVDEAGNIRIMDSVNEQARKSPDRNLSLISINEIVAEVCNYLNINGTLIASASFQRDVVFARCLIAYLAHYSAGFTLRHIAEIFRLMPDSVSKTMHKHAVMAKFKTAEKNIAYRLKIKQSDKLCNM